MLDSSVGGWGGERDTDTCVTHWGPDTFLTHLTLLERQPSPENYNLVILVRREQFVSPFYQQSSLFVFCAVLYLCSFLVACIKSKAISKKKPLSVSLGVLFQSCFSLVQDILWSYGVSGGCWVLTWIRTDLLLQFGGKFGDLPFHAPLLSFQPLFPPITPLPIAITVR